MKPNYLKRLKLLSIYLQRWTLIEVMNCAERPYFFSIEKTNVPYFLWAIKHCPKIYGSNWRMDNERIPYLAKFPDLNPIEACRHFFGLSRAETCALFMPGFTYDPYNLPALKPDSTPGDVAHQIHWFIVRKEQELKYKINTPIISVL